MSSSRKNGRRPFAGMVALLPLLMSLSACTRQESSGARQGQHPGFEYIPIAIGAPVSEFGEPWVSHVAIADLDQDGLPDVLYCEGKKNSVRWIRQSPRGVFTERIIATDIRGPVHVATADVNASGRLDVLVASMGLIVPNNDRIGAVIILENEDNETFRPRVLIENIARVTDVRAVNLMAHPDGRLDLIVGQFGYIEGEVSWMKNLGDWKFERTVLHEKPGAVHLPVADFDGDGRLDFAALIAQHDEEVRWFRHVGEGQFEQSVVWRSSNTDYGSSGMSVVDLNRDGRPDLLFTNGDGLDYPGSDQRPWHGIQWLENLGAGAFRYHRIGDQPGAYGPCAADLDGDGDMDVIAVSAFADWSSPKAVSLMAWINDGQNRFTPVPLARRPTGLITAAVGDLDGNGVPVIVTGGFHPWAPFDHMSNVTLWRRK